MGKASPNNLIVLVESLPPHPKDGHSGIIKRISLDL